MTTPAQVSQRTEPWIWVLVVAATASVVALAVLQNRPQEPHPATPAALSVTLPRLDGQGKAPLPAGRITMVDFWATWCAPCRASMPRLQTLWQEYQPKGVILYSVDTDDDGPNREPSVREFLLQNRLSFPVVLDDGSASQAFSVSSLPTLVLLDKQGQIAWSHVGALTAGREKELRLALDRALGH